MTASTTAGPSVPDRKGTLDDVPAELRDRQQWVAHSDKQPYVAGPSRGRRASSTDPQTWRSLAEAGAATWADGAGFVFSKDDAYVGVDLDDCFREDGTLYEGAAAIVAALDSYTERSPSGCGLHIIARGSWSDDVGNKRPAPWGGAVEVYSHGRYFTVTGDAWPAGPKPIAERQDALDGLALTFGPKGGSSALADDPNGTGALTPEDNELLEQARASERFVQLYDEGDLSAYDDDHSRADLALCGLLAAVTQDPDQVDRLFRGSKLCRSKWLRRGQYRNWTISKALEVVDDDFEIGPDGMVVTGGEGVSVSRADTPVTPSRARGGLTAEQLLEQGPVGRTAAHLKTSAPPEPNWLIPGVAAKGWTVKWAAREKAGKGTLVMNLLGKLERVESTVFGPAGPRTTSVVYTEEPEDTMAEKVRQAGLEHARIIYGWELAVLKDWRERARYLVAVAVREGHGLVFVDNISRATGADDEAGTELARSVEILSDAAKRAGVTVFIDHHHRKAAGKLEDKSRGGTALAGACENNIEMERRGDWTSRVRKLSSRGRHSATIWERTIALSEDGTDYYLVAGDQAPQSAEDRGRLRELADADDGMTVKEYAAAVELSENPAREVLKGFAQSGWAQRDKVQRGNGRPANVWSVTQAGLEALDPESSDQVPL